LKPSGGRAGGRARKFGVLAGAALLLLLAPRPARPQSPRVIEILADHDSRFKMAGLKEPEIEARAGEQLTLRVRAVKAKNRNRDGSIHGLALLRGKDRSRVAGWDFLLKPGVQDLNATAPTEPGEYVVVCTVICSDDHEGMHMRFVVLP
jgi:hypothetical protein